MGCSKEDWIAPEVCCYVCLVVGHVSPLPGSLDCIDWVFTDYRGSSDTPHADTHKQSLNIQVSQYGGGRHTQCVILEHIILMSKFAAVITLKDGCRLQPVLRDQTTVTSHSGAQQSLSTQIRVLHSSAYLAPQVPRIFTNLTSANAYIAPGCTTEKNYSPIPALNVSCPIPHLPVSKLSPSFLMGSGKFCFTPFMSNSLALNTRDDRQMRVQHPPGSEQGRKRT